MSLIYPLYIHGVTKFYTVKKTGSTPAFLEISVKLFYMIIFSQFFEVAVLCFRFDNEIDCANLLIPDLF